MILLLYHEAWKSHRLCFNMVYSDFGLELYIAGGFDTFEANRLYSTPILWHLSLFQSLQILFLMEMGRGLMQPFRLNW